MEGMKLAFAAALLVAQATAATAGPAPGKPAGDPGKKICRIQADIGTRLGGKRICRTSAEWAQVRAEARRTVDRMQDGPTACALPTRC
jgi:hypothetical protein